MADKKASKRQPSHKIIGAGGIPSSVSFGTPTIWLTANFAQFWYDDAKKEATEAGDTQRRRREITFSVAALESYLLEWVRDEVLNRDFHRLDIYFPPGERRPVTEKWKSITKKLATDRLVAAAPDFSSTTWHDFKTLVEYRNGLIHARASRPQTHGLADAQMPLPSMKTLYDLSPGWAVQVCERMIHELHTAIGTGPPEWLNK